METDLTRMPFDHFQRYGTAISVLERLGARRLRILEVGANRQRILSKAFPEADILYTDIVASGDDADLVLASAAALPFGDSAFDAVVCLDVLEHIPADLRDGAVREMARVAARLVIIGCPIEASWVKDAESSANECWSELFGGDYPWLAEHQEFGLVDADAVESTLEAQVPYLRRVSQGSPGLWSALMATHFMKERAPSLGQLVARLDHLYNTAVFEGDFPPEGYREYFIGVRREADVACVSEWLERSAVANAGVAAFLETMPEVIRPVVDGIVRTEAEWTSTLGLYQDQQRDLTTTKDEWGKTAAALEQVRGEAARFERDFGVAQSGWEEALATLAFLRDREISLVRDLDVAKAGWEEAVGALASLRLRETSLAQDLNVAQAGWKETVATLEAARADSLRMQEEAVRLAADLDTAKREWSATAQLLEVARAEGQARILDFETQLEEAHARRQKAEHMAHAAKVGRTRAVYTLAIVVVVSIAAMAAIALS